MLLTKYHLSIMKMLKYSLALCVLRILYVLLEDFVTKLIFAHLAQNDKIQIQVNVNIYI